MSGLGYQQRVRLASMAEDPTGMCEAEHASEDRIMRSLEDRGLVEYVGQGHQGRRYLITDAGIEAIHE